MASRRFLIVVSGTKIYVAANPLRSDRRKRTKDSIATVRHLYLDFDVDGEARLTSLRTSDTVLTPTAVLSTLLGKCQILCRIDSFTFEQQESALKLFAIPFGGDRTSMDCNRVLRWPGFRNCKHDPSNPITVKYPCDSTSNPASNPSLSAGYSGGKCVGFAPCNPIAKAPRKAHQFQTRLGADPARTCPRKRRREADANDCFPPLA